MSNAEREKELLLDDVLPSGPVRIVVVERDNNLYFFKLIHKETFYDNSLSGVIDKCSTITEPERRALKQSLNLEAQFL